MKTKVIEVMIISTKIVGNDDLTVTLIIMIALLKLVKPSAQTSQM